VLELGHLPARSRADVFHHDDELFEGDVAVTVFVDLLDDLVDGLGRHGVLAAEVEDLLDLVSGDGARAVLVEHLEGGLELIVGSEGVLVHGGQNELRVVDEAGAVGVDGVEHDLDLLVGHDLAVVLEVALLDLVHGELAVSVLVEGLEHLSEVVLLTLGDELGSNESVSSLLQGLVRAELAHVGEHVRGESLVNGHGAKLNQPGVGESLLGGGSLGSLVGQKLGDEVLAVIRDRGPGLVVKVKGTLADFTHNFLVGLAVERRLAGEEDVSDDTAGPDVALGVVVLVKNLRGDVVGGSELLVEGAGGIVDEGGTEVNDLELVELLVLLEEDVLGLEISVK
jgi:hypothetical protein